MAVPLQTKYPISAIKTNIPRNQRSSLLHVRVRCPVTNTTNFDRDNEKLVVKKHLVNPHIPNDSALESTWTQRLWVAAGCTTVFASFAKSTIGGFHPHIWLEPALASYAGYALADLATGVFHWALDNYGDESTPIVGTLIEDFGGHHKWPWRITKQQFANKLHAPARGATFLVLPFNLASNDPVLHGFVSTFAFFIMFSQQFHAWSHQTKSKLPHLVAALQDMGLILPRKHVEHHRPPYNNNYCIVSGAWNKVLDDNKVFEAMEKMLYLKFGIRPRSWSVPNSEWEEETDIPNNNQT